MSETKSSLATTATTAAALKRPALSSTVNVTATNTATVTVPVGVVSKTYGGSIMIPDLTRPSRKQSSPMRQPAIAPVSTASPQTIIHKTKSIPPTAIAAHPPPPPLVAVQLSPNVDHNYAAHPEAAKGSEESAQPPLGKEAEVKSSSESSSDESSSESTSTSGEESDKEKEEALKAETVSTIIQPVIVTVPQQRERLQQRRRGRPRKNQLFTPQPPKSGAAGEKDGSRTTPRKRPTGRAPKPPALFSKLIITELSSDGKRQANLPKKRGRGCGACPGCLRGDCGKCNYCLDKTKFGGPGKKKQRCALRVCSNFVSSMKANNTPVRRTTHTAMKAVSGDIPTVLSSEVIPASKLTNAARVVQVIEQLKQNINAAAQATEEREGKKAGGGSVLTSLMVSKVVSLSEAKPVRLKATPSVVVSTIMKAVPVIPSTAATTTVTTSNQQVPPTKDPPTKTPPTKDPPTKAPPSKDPPTKAMPSKDPPTKAPPSKDPPTKAMPSKDPPTKAPPYKDPPTKALPSKDPPTKALPSKDPPTKAPPSKDPPTKAPLTKHPPTKALPTKDPPTKVTPAKVMPICSQLAKTPPTSAPQATPTTASTAQSETKTSEIALRTRRKQQQKDKKSTDGNTPAADSSSKMKCIQCGRERKIGMARTEKFCTQRCMNIWVASSESNLKDEEVMDVDGVATTEVVTQQRKVARALKHLQIDMAFTPSIKPTMTSTPTHTATTAANKRPTASTSMQPANGKKSKDETIAGTKRPSVQPPASKRVKEDNQKSVSFNLIPTSTVDPISAPPLSRTVPPPSISIVPLDQLTALGTALFTQQQKKSKDDLKKNSKLPDGLPVDVHSWNTSQVVKYFESTSDCKEYASVFREQEIDGTALLLLTHESLVKCLSIKLGRALKIMVHVEELQRLYSE